MKIKHHKIPRLYLHRFATPQAKKKHPVLWVYDMAGDAVYPSTPIDSGVERHAYTITLRDGTRSDIIEDIFEKQFESPAAPLFDKLIANGTLKDDERELFASFLGLILVRTDAFRQKYAQWAMALRQIEEKLIASSDRTFEARIRKIEKGSRKFSQREKEAVRDLWLNPQRYELSVSKEWTVRALAAFEHAALPLHDMQWSVMRATGAEYFVTSDNPVVLEKSPKNAVSFSPALAEHDVKVTMPLSPSYCLLATWDREVPRHFDLPREGVRHCNRLRAAYATDYLYGPRKDSGIRRLAAKYRGIGPSVAVESLDQGGLSRVHLRRGTPEPA